MPNDEKWYEWHYLGTAVEKCDDTYYIKVIEDTVDLQNEATSLNAHGRLNESALWDKRLIDCVRKKDKTSFTSEELTKMKRPLKNALRMAWLQVNNFDEAIFLASINQMKEVTNF